jgi:O-antigen/teichoic acid export membrane protein
LQHLAPSRISSFSDRSKAVLLGSAAGIAARTAGLIANLLITALLARAFSREEFGFWSVLLRFLPLSVIAFFGLNLGITNKLAALSADSFENADRQQRDYFLSAFYFLLLANSVAILLSVAFVPRIPWALVLNIHDTTVASASTPLVLVAICSLLLYVPLC